MASYYSTLTEAVNDLLDHGYDSPRRLDYWRERLRDSARVSLLPKDALTNFLQKSFTRVYDREIERGHSLSNHIGMDKFEIERLKPYLRSELDRRMMTAGDLVERNRDESIERSMRALGGWAASLPRGGVALPARNMRKSQIRRPLSSLGLVERRIINDQGDKMVSALNAIIAKEGGAIAAQWHSKGRVPGYNYREDHRERDQKFYAIKGCSAHRDGLINRGAGYTESMTHPAEEPNCRCRYVYHYSLESLPEEMLTRKGKKCIQ